MARKRKSGVGGDGADAKRPRIYACAAGGCKNRGIASEMRNLACDPGTITMEELVRLIRCPSCSETGPSQRWYPLNRTLSAMRRERYAGGDRGRQAEERAYVQWVLRSQRDRVIRDYAEIYGALPEFCDPSSLEADGLVFPEQRLDEKGTHCCGLPVSCCDKRAPAARYLTVLGEVVGICRKASAIFFEVRNLHREEPTYRRLLSTEDERAARKFADRWLRGGRR